MTCMVSGSQVTPLSTLQFILHLAPIRTPFKDSRQILSLEILQWLSISLKKEPKVLNAAPRSTGFGPHSLPDFGSYRTATHKPGLGHTGPLGLLGVLSAFPPDMPRLSAFAAASGIFSPKHLCNSFHFPQVSTQLPLIREPSPDPSI